MPLHWPFSSGKDGLPMDHPGPSSSANLDEKQAGSAPCTPMSMPMNANADTNANINAHPHSHTLPPPVLSRPHLARHKSSAKKSARIGSRTSLRVRWAQLGRRIRAAAAGPATATSVASSVLDHDLREHDYDNENGHGHDVGGPYPHPYSYDGLERGNGHANGNSNGTGKVAGTPDMAHRHDRDRRPNGAMPGGGGTDAKAVDDGEDDDEEEDADRAVDRIVVDRVWSEAIRSSTASEPEKTLSNPHPSTTVQGDRDSLVGMHHAKGHPHPHHPHSSPRKPSHAHALYILLRWRLFPALHTFFAHRFPDPTSEHRYRSEVAYQSRGLAFASSLFFVVNWVLGTAFAPRPIELADKIFYYGVAPALTVPLVPMIIWDWPRKRRSLYQTYVTFSVWSWSLYQIFFIHWCGYYNIKHMRFSCGTRDFLSIFYYTTALQTIALFGLKLNRLPAMFGALFFLVSACVLVVPDRVGWSRNVINFAVFQGFLLYIHYMREMAERRMYTLRDQLKMQYKATARAQLNERRAADSKRRLTSYVFHEVRVPLNTALLAVQNMDAAGTVPRTHEIEFKALGGSLTMMSKVLNDVLDFNRMDSGRFESVHRPYAFHAVIRSIFLPLQIATGARGLTFVTELDGAIDKAARRAAYRALGYTASDIDAFLSTPTPGPMSDAAKDGVVVGDETRLRQVITNLASNACKFTPTGGSVTVRTKLILPQPLVRDEEVPVQHDVGAGEGDLEKGRENGLPLGPADLSEHNLGLLCEDEGTRKEGAEWIVVRIEIEDTGCGIRAKDMAESKLFSPFNQTELGRQQGGKGTGLGLALVRSIVKLSGGRLGVRSKVGHGSCFWVELPLGVGAKALEVSHDQQLDALDRHRPSTSGFDPDLLDAGVNPRHGPVMPPNERLRSSQSALHSIMEQGGLVELAPDNRSSGILTRAIGDASTGTEVLPPVMLDELDSEHGSSPSPLRTRPAMPEFTSSSTVIDRSTGPPSPVVPIQPQPRPTFVQLPPRPPAFGVVADPSPAASSAPSHTTDFPLSASTTNTSLTFERGLPVLVVDDDPLTRMLMKRMLTRLGCAVSTAENGALALEMIMGGAGSAAGSAWGGGPGSSRAGLTPSSEARRSLGTGSAEADELLTSASSSEHRYAAIFLDNQMPVLSGLEAVARLREAGRRDFVVGVTGNALISDQQEYFEAGVDHVLTKPVFERSLRNMLVLADERRRRLPVNEHHQPEMSSSSCP